MRPDTAALPLRYLRTKEAAEFLSLSARTLEKHRTYGTGPAYRKLGGRVVYAVDDLETWAERGAVTSTSDPRGSVLPAKRQTLPTGQIDLSAQLSPVGAGSTLPLRLRGDWTAPELKLELGGIPGSTGTTGLLPVPTR